MKYKEIIFSKVFKDIANLILDLIYPENITCIICDKPINKNNTYSMCKGCFKDLHFILDGCIKCGKPIINHSLEKQDINGCSYCFNKGFYFDKAISCIEYDNLSKKLILDLKYKNKTYMSKYVAQIMKEKLEIENIKVDYITCVPLHKGRLKKRGFNQAKKISVKLGNLIDVEHMDIIERKNNTIQLYKLNKDERKRELKNAFVINDKYHPLKNKNILLIDDIFTTGSTVNEISKILKLKGINKVFVMTLLTKPLDVYIAK